MKKLLCELVLPLSLLACPSTLFAQARFYEWHWEAHPLWAGAWAIGIILAIILFWVVVLIGFVVGLRWLLRKRRSAEPDSALTILRERYARSEINQDEFEQKIKDLS